MEGVRIPWGTGIVGHVAATSKSLCIDDAYKDERFDAEVDRKTNFRTRSILTVPVTDRDGKAIAVIQVLGFQSNPCAILLVSCCCRLSTRKRHWVQRRISPTLINPCWSLWPPLRASSFANHNCTRPPCARRRKPTHCCDCCAYRPKPTRQCERSLTASLPLPIRLGLREREIERRLAEIDCRS